MRLVGYSDRLSAAPGDTISFMVSCTHLTYRSDLVRLIHGDENPKGPGYKEREIVSEMSREHVGRPQLIETGSYVLVEDAQELRLSSSFTLAVWVHSTTPGKGIEGLMTKGAPGIGGYGLTLGDRGDLALWLDDGAGNTDWIRTDVPLTGDRWYFVAASYDALSDRVTLYQSQLREQQVDEWETVVEACVAAGPSGGAEKPFLMGAWDGVNNQPGDAVGHHFNGKLDRPRILDRALGREEIGSIRSADISGAVYTPSTIASWDFSKEMGYANVIDTGVNQLAGRAMNLPTRAVTGYNWDGSVLNFNEAPEQYGAIYFHDDDFDDAGWEIDFTFSVPEGLSSGVYAARLRSNGDEEYLPFFVRPPKGTATSEIAFLIPTLTYVTYANFHDISEGLWDSSRIPHGDQELHKEQYDYILQNDMVGLYDLHSDGSGTVYSSMLRPILNMRPKFRYRVWGAPSRFPADLYMTDWLDEKGYEADIITDHDLHEEGDSLLSRYKVVITGSHPEYWTSQMLAGLETYLGQGGRLMYLGGNGFYGIVSVDPERPHFVELRRWAGSWPFELPAGERYHNTTGEPGGIWRNRGKAPQQLVGVGSCAAGFDSGSPYVRQQDSFDESAQFIFEGISDNERLGDFPSLVMRHGAAGYEMDRLDHRLGTPVRALLLASSVGHSDLYQPFREDLAAAGKKAATEHTTKDEPHPLVRSDIVYFETPNDGAVFSVGSIGFRASLSYNQYDNNISRMVDNVLKNFLR